MERLERYRRKRDAAGTPEPMGGEGAESGGRMFVVQKHAARRTHYDLRLEHGGVLWSWAVPKTPSYDQAVKRMAVHVEDHPVEYAAFEGVIPEGNYGAGAVIVWDRGTWIPLEDPEAGLESGKLLFELAGHKLRGRWTLVKIKKAENDWLLIKERDALEGEGRDAFDEASIVSGLTVEELGEGVDRGAEAAERLRELGAKRRRVEPEAVRAMLAETRAEPFDRAGWLFELKYDGYRMIAAKADGRGRLITRRGNEATSSFPEVTEALAALPYEHVVLDGEVVVHDDAGLPSFQRLQRRGQLRRALDIRRATVELPATLYVFDLLALDDLDARALPLERRKEVLARLIPRSGPLRYSDHVPERGSALYAQVTAMGLEGIVAKRADSPYRAGRSADWLKIRADRLDDFAVVGFTRPEGSRAGFGALHLALWRGDGFVYAGRAGSGFTEAQLEAVHGRLETLRRDDPPCAGAPTGREHVWVEPELVCEVRYKESTQDGVLRQPVFVRFREDKTPRECVIRTAEAEGEEETEAGADGADVDAVGRVTGAGTGAGTAEGSGEGAGGTGRDGGRRVVVSNPDKVFWPGDGYTKADLVGYYRAIAPWLLPYLRDRPVVLTRYPDGIEGKSFFQKDAPGFAPGWLRRHVVASEGEDREISYFVCDDADGLAYLANMGTIPLHVWASRTQALERPDWCSLDLDPKDAPFSHVVRVATAVRALCSELGLPSYPKTTGSSGIHVLIPLGGALDHEQAKQLGELLARVIVGELPEIATIERVVSQRAGRVYVDYLQNGRGKLLVAPFSARPVPGALVSMPLAWDEVGPELDLRDYTIANAVERMERLGADPVRPVLADAPDLSAVLERLARRMAG